MRIDRKIRFYNAGDRIQSRLLYSDPGGHDNACIAYHMLDAPAGGFFDVPEEANLSGAVIRLTFDRDIMRDYGPRGVIMIDANYTPQPDEEQDDKLPIAATADEAVAKAERMWQGYVKDRVKDFMEQCESIRSVGGVPRPADRVVLRYLKIMGMVDPSEAMLRESQKQTSVVETLTDRLDRLEAENKRLRAEKEPEETAADGPKRKGKTA